MSQKYTKVKDIQVLKKYKELIDKLATVGFPYIPIDIIKEELNTSEYQIRRAYKNLEQEGYMKKIKIPVYCEEYDNGLYTEAIPILYAKVFDITEKGIEKCIKN